MKLHLCEKPDDIWSGYLNVHPQAPEHPDCFAGPWDGLSLVCEANEATEIVADDVLDRFPSDRVDDVLSGWLSRLAHGGELHLSFVDARPVCRAFYEDRLDLGALNALLHDCGPWPRRCLLSIDLVCAVLENQGYRLLRRRLDGHRALVSCRRP